MHHTNANQEIILCKWLKKNVPSKLPSFSTHNLGVNGFVLSPCRTKILTVKEKIFGSNSLWKFPGGLVDP